jgi:carbon storage regulator
MIGDNIRVTVIQIVGDKVRLGIDAPLDMPIYRQEVFDVIQKHRNDNPPNNPMATW